MARAGRLDIKDWVLVIGVCLAPMTGLRIWKVGPGEVVCLLYCILNYNLIRKAKNWNMFTRFWLCFLASIAIGTLVGVLSYPLETIPSDLLTWLYFAIVSVGIFSIVQQKNAVEVESILTGIVHISPIWFALLYSFSLLGKKTILGAPIWYHEVRFSGGGTNPHQVALLLSFCIVAMIWFVIRKTGVWRRLFHLLLTGVSVFLLVQTKSSTAIMATAIGVFIVIWNSIWVNCKNKRKVLSGAIILLFFTFALFGRSLFEFIVNWVKSDSNGLDRFILFASFPKAFLKSPVFGLGPGVHALNGLMEFHNTYLEILAMSGLIGFIIFTVFSIKLFKSTFRSAVSFGVLVSAYCFGLAGFGARRLVFWAIIVIIYIYALKSNEFSEVSEEAFS